MWIARPSYERLLKERDEAHGANRALEQQTTTQKITMDWLMVRLTQLEHERAQLLHRYMGVEIVVPTMEPTPSAGSVQARALEDLPSFADMGDEQAKAAGLDWDTEGRVTLHGKVL